MKKKNSISMQEG